jgi:hypothetical protein
MPSRQTHQRKKCITNNCRGFAVNKLPLTGEIFTKCKSCREKETERKDREEKEHPEVEKKLSKFQKPAECGICYTDCKDCTLVVIKPCQHWICSTCVENLKEEKCPFCRCDIERNPLKYRKPRRGHVPEFLRERDQYYRDLHARSRSRHARRDREEREERVVRREAQRELEQRERQMQGLIEDINEMLRRMLADVPTAHRQRFINEHRGALLRTLGVYA